jgi:hypothetical protein
MRELLAKLGHESAHHMTACATELDELFFAADPGERRMIMMNLDCGNGKQSHPVPDASSVSRLEATALQGRTEEFTRELGRTLQISHAHAQRIALDPSGEPLVVAAKVLAVPTDVLQRILLSINPAIGHSVRRIHHLTALHKDMSLASARQLLAIWQQAATRELRVADHPRSNADEQSRSVGRTAFALRRDYAWQGARIAQSPANARYRQGNDVQRDPRSQ